MALASTLADPDLASLQTDIVTASGTPLPVSKFTSTLTSTPTPTSPATATMTTTTAPHQPLAPGTIAGIAIASIFAAALAFLLLGCLISRLRTRRLVRHRRLDDPPPPPNPGPPAGPNSHDRDPAGRNVAAYDVLQPRSAYPKMQAAGAGARMDPARVGVAVSSERERERQLHPSNPSNRGMRNHDRLTPSTATSQTTNNWSPASVSSLSKLLPPRPPSPALLPHHSQAANRETHAPPSHRRHRASNWTVFEEDGPSSPFPIQPPSSLRPRGSATVLQSASPSPIWPPTPALLFPPNAPTTTPKPTTSASPAPSSAYSPHNTTGHPRLSTRSTTSSYLPTYYTHPPPSACASYFPASPLLAHPACTMTSPPLPLPPPPPQPSQAPGKTPPPPPPSLARRSTGSSSKTTFESLGAGSDLATPPEEDSLNLKSNTKASGGGVVVTTPPRYPKVPRPANLAVPRCGPYAMGSARSGKKKEEKPMTLAEKRRMGREVAGKGAETGKGMSVPVPVPLGERSGNVGAGGSRGGRRDLGEEGGKRDSGVEMVMKRCSGDGTGLLAFGGARLTPTRGAAGEMVIRIE